MRLSVILLTGSFVQRMLLSRLLLQRQCGLRLTRNTYLLLHSSDCNARNGIDL